MATLTRAESLAILSGGAKGKGTPALEQDEEKQNGSQNSGSAVMSREESLKILSEGAAGTYKPKNETVSNSPSTAGLADMFTPFGATKAAWAAPQQTQRAKLQKELDRLDNAAAYVTTTEQSDEIDAQRKPIIEQLRKLDEAEGKTGVYTGGDRLKNALGNAKLATQQGLTQADHRIAQTADWLFGGIAKEGKALVNATLQTINPNWGFKDEDPWITRYNKRGAEVLAQNDAIAQQRIEEGKLNKTAWKYAPEVVAAIPDAVLAFATGGAIAGGQATRAGLETASAIAQGSSAAQKLIPIADAAKNMMKSPAWLSAFAQTAGGSYEEALADGATEEQANLYALLNGFANATIEVGGSDEAMGGIQKLPQQLRDALEKGNKNAVMQWVKSTAGEATEEVLQGMAEKGLRGLYTDVPLYSDTDENAVINPKRAKEEALGGLIVGGVLGGGQTALQSAINSGRGQNANGAQDAQEMQSAAGDISAPPAQANADTGASARLNSDVQTDVGLQNAEGIKKAASEAANADIAGDSRVANAEVSTPDMIPAAQTEDAEQSVDYDTGRYNRAAKAAQNAQRATPQAETPPATANATQTASDELNLRDEGNVSSSDYDTQRLESLMFSEAPQEAVHNTDSFDAVTANDDFQNRDFNDVGNRKIKAYMYENPEVKPFFQFEAEAMLSDLKNSVKGERFYNSQLAYDSGSEYGWTGNKRLVSDDIAVLLDYGYSYEEIEKGLKAIIEDDGRENNACSKRIEFLLNDRLMDGYTDWLSNEFVPPNQEYRNMILEKQINAYSKEAFEEYLKAETPPPTANAAQAAPGALNMQEETTAQGQKTTAAQNAAPANDNQTTGQRERPKGANAVRGFSVNIATDEAMNEDLRESHRESPDTYEPLANKDVLAKANAIYAEGFESARNKLQQAIGAAKNGGSLAPEMLPLGRMVANELAKSDLKAAREITSDLAVELTKAGQFIQAAKLLRQTGASPLDVMDTIAKGLAEINKAVAEKYPRKAEKWEAALTDAEIEQIQNTDFKQDGAFESVYEQVMKRVGEEMPAGLWEKLTEIRRISMLLNPKTQIKNAASNIPMMGMRKVSEKLSGAIQDGLTAVGWMDKAEQTRTSNVSGAKKELARRVYDEVKDDIKGQSNKWDMRQDINKYRTYFKKGAIQKFIERKVGKEMQHSVLESTRQLTYELLETGDAPFVKSAFVDSLAQYCAAQGIHNRADVTQAAIDFATANAMEATFKNANAIATALNNLKRNSSVASAALDVLLPFTTTPANIMQLTLDYSPLGFFKALGSNIMGKSTMAQRIDMISKATTGSALMALGFALRAMGKITGAEPDDEDEAEWQKANGWQPYSFRGKDGGWYYAYDWAQPVGSMLVFGSEIYDAIQGREDWRDAVFNAVYASGDSALNMSLFQNILGVLKGTGSPTEKVLEEIITGGATQFMPGIAGAIARTIDETKRSTYTGADVIDDTKARLQANTPFASKKLPASVNVKGEENTRGNLGERILQNFISPGNFSKGKGKKTDVDKEIESLYAETEDNSIFPRKSPYKVSYDGETYTFTGDERADFQKIQGNKYYELASKLIASDIYRNASGYDRAKMLAEISSFSLDAAKRDFFKDKDGVEYSSDKYDSIYESGTKNAWEYLGAKTAFTQAKKQNDYSAQDKFLKVYDQLTAGTKRMLENSSATARMDDMAEAYEKGGIRAKEWNTVYEKYKELNGTKRSGYTASDKATDFEAWMEREGFTQNQRKILTDQFTFFSQVPGDAGRYNSLKDAGFDTDSAYAIYDKVSSLTAPTGEKTVKDWQKLEAINSLDLSGEEKIKALSVYYPPNDDGKEDAMVRRYKAAEEQGISFATWTKAMKIIAGADGTSRKAIFAAVQEAGYTETDAQIIYDIWKHS